MPEYIDRDFVIDLMCGNCRFKGRCKDDDGEMGCPDVQSVSEAPAAEVRANTHGEWIDGTVAFHLTCSICGCNIRKRREVVFEGNYDYNFCPNCGAYNGGGETHYEQLR